MQNNKVNGNGIILINNYLNVNGLNAPTKRQRLAKWIQRKTPYVLSTRDPPQTKGHIQTESKGLEKDILCN